MKYLLVLVKGITDRDLSKIKALLPNKEIETYVVEPSQGVSISMLSDMNKYISNKYMIIYYANWECVPINRILHKIYASKKDSEIFIENIA